MAVIVYNLRLHDWEIGARGALGSMGVPTSKAAKVHYVVYIRPDINV